MQGWLNNATKEEVELVRRYLTGSVPGIEIKDEGLCPALIRAAMASTARFAVFPLQDLFAVGSEGRMNTPSTTGGHNWQWRMKSEHFDAGKAAWLKELSALYGRNMGCEVK
jgi:4-alpha-glucanotransferase